MPTITIRHRWTDAALFSHEYTAALVLIDMHAKLWTPAAELAQAA